MRICSKAALIALAYATQAVGDVRLLMNSDGTGLTA